LSASRTFGALLAHDGVCLVEYRAERSGLRVVAQWSDATRSSSIDEAADRLVSMVSALGIARARIALAIEQFGVFHHVMTLPPARDDLLRPIVAREVQRVFGLTDPVFAFARAGDERAPDDAAARTAPRRLFVAGGPRDAIDALASRFDCTSVEIDIATVVPKAIHSLFEATGGLLEPTAVLVCLEGGPHLAFFLDGRLELAIDPPIALEGERAPVAVVLDQVERGAVYFRQQFRGATATRLLLAAPAADYDALAAALGERLSVRVSPLFSGASTPDAVVAMGAVLEARRGTPLDFYPHPPTWSDRARMMLRGPNAVVAGAAAAAMIVWLWSAGQFAALSSLRSVSDSLRTAVRAAGPTVEPMRRLAERRADFAHEAAFVGATRAERSALADVLRAIAQRVPDELRFDSLTVARANGAWSASIAGQSTGATAARAVRALDAFYQAVRSRPEVGSATLDQFDYSAPGGADSTRIAGGPVVANFRMSFSIARPAEGGR